MSTASATRAQEAHLHSIHRPPPAKKDFTATFQKVVPFLFFFVLGLAIYTRYRMSIVHPEKEQLQPFTPPPWETDVPQPPHVEVNFGEKKWAEMKKAFSSFQSDVEVLKEPSEEKLKSAWEGAIDKGKETWDRTKTVGEEKWEGVKDKGKEFWDEAKTVGHEKWEEGIHILETGKDKVDSAMCTGKESLREAAEIGKEKVREFAEIGKEKAEQIFEIGKEKFFEEKEKLEEALERGKDKIAEDASKVIEKGKEALNEGKEKLHEAGEILGDRAETVLDSVKETLPELNLDEWERQMQNALWEARLMHEHMTDNRAPPPHSKPISESFKEKVRGLFDSTAVYDSPAPFNAVCPILPPDTCPIPNMTYAMRGW